MRSGELVRLVAREGAVALPLARWEVLQPWSWPVGSGCGVRAIMMVVSPLGAEEACDNSAVDADLRVRRQQGLQVFFKPKVNPNCVLIIILAILNLPGSFIHANLLL